MNRIVLALSFSLTAAAAFAGTNLVGSVIDTEGNPLPNASVYVYTAHPRIGVSTVCPGCYRDCGKHEAVDAKGTFRLQSLDSSLVFNVLAVADGYEPAFANQVDPAHGSVSIALQPRSTADAGRLITGVVVDPKGKPVVGAIVEPSGYHSGRGTGYGNLPGLDKLSVTNAKGEFALRMPDVGKLDVRVTSRTYAPAFARTIAPGEMRTIPLIDGVTIIGDAKRDGKPLRGSRVMFIQRNRASSGYLGRLEIGTDDKGHFTMPNMATKEAYFVYIPMDDVSGAVNEPKLIETGDDKTIIDAGTLAAAPGRSVSGTIVVPEGAVIPPHTRITLIADPTGDIQTVEIRPDRTFTFRNVTSNAARLSLRIPGLRLPAGSPRRPEDFVVHAGGDVKEMLLEFER